MRKILFLFSLMAGLTSQSQIVYTNITDGIPNGIDFNNDGTYEFDISTGSGPGTYLTYYNYGADNNVHALGNLIDGGWEVPNCVALGYTIGSSGNWQGQGDCSIDANGGGNASITFNQDEFLAVRFNLGGTSIYYGWIRFSMTAAGAITYKDYAYNATPGVTINAGQTSALNITSFDDSTIVKIYPNPSNGIFIIESENLINATVKIVDALGRIIFNTSNTFSTNMDINMSSIGSGNYYLIIDNGNSKTVKTIVIK